MSFKSDELNFIYIYILIVYFYMPCVRLCITKIKNNNNCLILCFLNANYELQNTFVYIIYMKTESNIYKWDWCCTVLKLL